MVFLLLLLLESMVAVAVNQKSFFFLKKYFNKRHKYISFLYLHLFSLVLVILFHYKKQEIINGPFLRK